MAQKREITLLIHASDDYESWKWRDPELSEERVIEQYIQAESDARKMDDKYGTFFSNHPVTRERLQTLGIDPDTLAPLT